VALDTFRDLRWARASPTGRRYAARCGGFASSRRFNPKGPRMHLGCSRKMRRNPTRPNPDQPRSSTARPPRNFQPSVLVSPRRGESLANRNGSGFGWEMSSRGRSRRSPISLDTIVALTRMYTYDARVWDSSLVQGPFSVAPCRTFALRFATFPPQVDKRAHVP
jgi:hypothetical protein